MKYVFYDSLYQNIQGALTFNSTFFVGTKNYFLFSDPYQMLRNFVSVLHVLSIGHSNFLNLFS